MGRKGDSIPEWDKEWSLVLHLSGILGAMHSQQGPMHPLPWVCGMSYLPCWSKHSRRTVLGGIRVLIKRCHTLM